MIILILIISVQRINMVPTYLPTYLPRWVGGGPLSIPIYDIGVGQIKILLPLVTSSICGCSSVTARLRFFGVERAHRAAKRHIALSGHITVSRFFVLRVLHLLHLHLQGWKTAKGSKNRIEHISYHHQHGPCTVGAICCRHRKLPRGNFNRNFFS